MVDCIFVSSLFPNPSEPGRGLFNGDQLAALSKLGLQARVLSPLPWFPLVTPWKRGVPREATVAGIPVSHCRQVYLPLSRNAQNSRLYTRSIRAVLAKLIREHKPRFLWSSFAFPDGCGVAAEARRHGLPHVVSLLGSDINLNRPYASRWRVIVDALSDASLVLAKSEALREALPDAIRVKTRIDYNGVDQELFKPADRDEACGLLGLDPSVNRILFVGNLVPVKDVGTLIRAVARLKSEVRGQKSEVGEPCSPSSPSTSNLQLVLLGSGSEEPRLRQLAADLRLSAAEATADEPTSDLLFTGRKPREEVVAWMRACDVLCLPSLNEGVPNVVLEALASGMPVVASCVGGIPEVHAREQAGALVEPGDVAGFAAALEHVLEQTWDPQALRASVSSFTWDQNADTVMQALRSVGLP